MPGLCAVSLPEVLTDLLEGCAGVFDRLDLADVRDGLLQELVRPQTEGVDPASVQTAAQHSECDGARLFVDRDHLDLSLGQFFQPGVQIAEGFFDSFSQAHR